MMKVSIPFDAARVLSEHHDALTGLAERYSRAGHDASGALSTACEALRDLVP